MNTDDTSESALFAGNDIFDWQAAGWAARGLSVYDMEVRAVTWFARDGRLGIDFDTEGEFWSLLVDNVSSLDLIALASWRRRRGTLGEVTGSIIAGRQHALHANSFDLRFYGDVGRVRQGSGVNLAYGAARVAGLRLEDGQWMIYDDQRHGEAPAWEFMLEAIRYSVGPRSVDMRLKRQSRRRSEAASILALNHVDSLSISTFAHGDASSVGSSLHAYTESGLHLLRDGMTSVAALTGSPSDG